MMIKRSITLLTLFCFLGLGGASATPKPPELLAPTSEHAVSTVLITKFIDQYHYKETQLNDQQSAAILDEYLDSLDPNRSIFTQEDINLFNQYRATLDDALREGDLTPAYSIFRRFNQRRLERANHALALLDKEFDFSIDETYLFDREDAPWAKDQTELDEIWRKRVKNDVLILQLANKTDEELKKTLRKRYQRLVSTSEQFKSEDVYESFTNAYLRTIEPHTSYFSPRTSENFKINMSLSLEGIGAVLQSTDEYTQVQRIIPGGPADLGGQLHADDKIVGVGQGKDGEVEDVVGWRLDDVVDLIRGPKDSIVRLQILPETSGVDGPTKLITITRNKIKLEEQQAKKSIIEIPNGDKTASIGVVTIPTFYMDFEAYARGDEDFRSTTRDTKALIDELVAEDVEGIIIDLRNNGGGSLPEAISLTGLFIESGPVVQIRDNRGDVRADNDEDKSIGYNGPLAVLVNRFSASASEIFAGAIQDYGRGTVIGEPTFGKGTVQSVVDLNRFVREPGPKLGQLKLTMAQFFRVNGDSTQHRGVVPDIVFPTAEESNEQGERSLDNALPWANIKAANFTHYDNSEADLTNIETAHQQRVKSDSGFEFLLAQAQVRRDASDKTTVSLLKEERKVERETQETEQRERLNRFRASLGLEPIAESDDIDDEKDEASKKENENFKEEIQKIELKEAAAILVDLIRHPEIDQKLLTHQSPKQAAHSL